MTIELSKAHVGQRYVARDGEVWRYVRPYDLKPGWHLLGSPNGFTCEFTTNGEYYGNEASDHDLVRAPDEPAPAPSEAGDVGHSGEFGQATDDPDLLAWLTREHEKLVARFPDIEYIAGSDDTIFSVAATRMEALSADNEALRRDIAEGVKVPEGWQLVPKEPTEAMWDAGREPILLYTMKSPPDMVTCRSWFDPTKDQPPRYDGHFPKGDAAVWTYRAMLAAAPVPAARDWHSKHDGGGNG